MMSAKEAIATIHTRCLTPRVLMLLFTLEASAVTNLLTSLAGGDDESKRWVVLLASLFYLIAALYSMAAEAALVEFYEHSPNAAAKFQAVADNAADFGWWLAAHIAAVVYGTIMLWPMRD